MSKYPRRLTAMFPRSSRSAHRNRVTRDISLTTTMIISMATDTINVLTTANIKAINCKKSGDVYILSYNKKNMK